MLVALLNGEKVVASEAQRVVGYVCSGCGEGVVLHQGRVIAAHFEHRSGTQCAYATGETRAHLAAKLAVRDGVVARGVRAELEYVVPNLHGDRRADVMVWLPDGERVAVELQHISISLDDIERRAGSYAHQSIAQLWVPLLSSNLVAGVNRKRTVRLFEKWVHGFGAGRGMWCYSGGSFWLVRLNPHVLDCRDQFGSWYQRDSKKWRDLDAAGPYRIEDLCWSVTFRKAFQAAHYKWPAGRIAQLRPITLTPDVQRVLNGRPRRSVRRTREAIGD